MEASDDLEVVRGVDVADPDAIVAALTPDCVYHEDPTWLDGRTFRGRDAIAAILRDYVEIWGTQQQTIEWADAVGNGVIVAGIRQRGVTPQGGMPIDQVWTYVFEVKDGAIAELWAFADESQARAKAAELSAA